jgi:hypothetical protein
MTTPENWKPWIKTADFTLATWRCYDCPGGGETREGFADDAMEHTRQTGHRTRTRYLHVRDFEGLETECSPPLSLQSSPQPRAS